MFLYGGQIIFSLVFQVKVDEIPFLCSLKSPGARLYNFSMPLPIFAIQSLSHISFGI